MDQASSICFLLSEEKQFHFESHPSSHQPPSSQGFGFLLLMLLFFPFAYAALARAVSSDPFYLLVS